MILYTEIIFLTVLSVLRIKIMMNVNKHTSKWFQN